MPNFFLKFVRGFGSSLRGGGADERQLEHARKTKEAQARLIELGEKSRRRFSDQVLIDLLIGGWTEGRQADSEQMEAFQQQIATPLPEAVAAILREFGGLRFGRGRSIDFKAVDPVDIAHLNTLNALVGRPLYPVGWTNIFADDGLVVHADDRGQIFMDEHTGFEGQRTGVIEYVAQNMDRALEIMLGKGVEFDVWPETSKKAAWFYTLEGR